MFRVRGAFHSASSVTMYCAIAIICMLSFTPMSARGKVVHSSKGPVALWIDSSQTIIRLVDSSTSLGLQELLSTFDELDTTITYRDLGFGFSAIGVAASAHFQELFDSLNESPLVAFLEPVCTDGNDLYYATNQLIVSFSEYLQTDSINAILEEFDLVTLDQLEGTQDWLLCEMTTPQQSSVYDICEALHLLSGVEAAHPNFILSFVQSSITPHDEYFVAGLQPHTEIVCINNGVPVWSFSGLQDTTTIAIVDDGLQSHKELAPSRLVEGINMRGFPPDFNTLPEDSAGHGMAIAGIIGAKSNFDTTALGSGIAGMNQATKFMPIKLMRNGIWPAMSGQDAYRIATGISYAWQHGADILVCGWGVLPRNIPIIDNALETAAIMGRGGKGSPIIFAAGNWDPANPLSNYFVDYPAYVPSVLAVGSTDLNENRMYFSRIAYFTGDLDIVAPSGLPDLAGNVWTLDQMGYNFGYNSLYINPAGWNCDDKPGGNDKDLNCRFGGTSASAAFAAGAASLLLSKDPTLTAYQVYYILKKSAVVVPEMDPDTLYIPDLEHGYGRVDAFRAVLSISHGDVNNDASIDIADLSYLIDFLFNDGPDPFPSVRLGDADCVGEVDIGDVSFLIDHLFVNNTPIPSPCFNY